MAERDAAAAEATIGLVLDCADPERLATFWAAALGYDHLGTYANHTLLLPRRRPGPKLVLQGVPEPKRHKNRMHLDVIVDDIDRCAARLESLGAVRDASGAHEQLGHRWIVMADPEGNEFCVCNGGPQLSPPRCGWTRPGRILSPHHRPAAPGSHLSRTEQQDGSSTRQQRTSARLV